MSIIPVRFGAKDELDVLKAFDEILPYFDDPLIRNMTQRWTSFEAGALEYVGRGGVYAVLCQSFIEGERAIASTVAIVDAEGMDAMVRGEDLRPYVSLTSYVGTSFPGIQAILPALAEAVSQRIAEHQGDPDARAGFDWCVSIERRARERRQADAGQVAGMTPALSDTSRSRRAA